MSRFLLILKTKVIFFSSNRIEGAASQKMTDFSERSATGMQYLLEKHAIMEIDINLAPITVVVPTKGVFVE